MLIGFMGGISFQVSSGKVRTFTDYSRSGASRIAQHDRIGLKPVAEFVAPGAEEVQLKIKLSAWHGVTPEAEIRKLRRMRDTGELFPVFIGGRPLSQYNWYIKSIDENVDYWTKFGRVMSATVSLTIAESGGTGASIDVAEILEGL